MKPQTKFLAAVAIACTAAAGSLPAQAGSLSTQNAAEQITVTVLRGAQSILGPDGNRHDMIMPANYVLKVGVPVHLTIVNYDEGPHTMTSAKMGLDIQIKGGIEQADGTITPVTTEVTFTPKATGNFRWYCAIPCDKGGKYWAMSKGYDGPGQDGYMAGYFIVM